MGRQLLIQTRLRLQGRSRQKYLDFEAFEQLAFYDKK